MAVKIAAECLQVDVSHFAIIAADTDVTPFDVGAYASSGTYFTGSAVFNTAKQMKEKILQAASEYLQEPIQNLSLEFPIKLSLLQGKEVQYAQLPHAHSGVGKGQLTGHSFYYRRSSYSLWCSLCSSFCKYKNRRNQS